MSVPRASRRRGLSLIELLACVAIVGAIAAIIIPRITLTSDTAKQTVCEHNCKQINTAIDRYALDNDGSFPADLSDIDTVYYFPDGIPVCPVSGSAYTINSTTNHVDAHPTTHP